MHPFFVRLTFHRVGTGIPGSTSAVECEGRQGRANIDVIRGRLLDDLNSLDMGHLPSVFVVPGLRFRIPVFLATAYTIQNLRKTGPIRDTLDKYVITSSSVVSFCSLSSLARFNKPFGVDDGSVYLHWDHINHLTNLLVQHSSLCPR